MSTDNSSLLRIMCGSLFSNKTCHPTTKIQVILRAKNQDVKNLSLSKGRAMLGQTYIPGVLAFFLDGPSPTGLDAENSTVVVDTKRTHTLP